MDYYIKKKLTGDCEITEVELETMSKREQLDAILSYEGIIGYTSDIIDLIERIWKVEL